jgi:hypothetical protein
MKNNRLQKFESKTASEPSPEQIKQAREAAVNMIMAVYDRMPKDNIKPVKESFQELARQAKEGVLRQSTIIQSSESDTKIISGGSLEVPPKFTDIDTGTSEKVPPKFTDFEMELLRQIQNGEQ